MATAFGGEWFYRLARQFGRAWRKLPGGGILPFALAKRLERLERLNRGGHVTYIGNNRLLTRLVVDDFILAFLVEADDKLIIPPFIVHGIHEAVLTRFFINNVKENHNCLDIGANFGYYACLMAKFAESGKTIGIEPQSHVYELLRDNIFINNLHSHARSINAAVGASSGRLTLYRRDTRSGNTSIIKASGDDVRYLGEAPPEPFDVDSVAIDDLLPEFDNRIDIIKIDVEGAEPLVFQGARRTIAVNPQVKIVMEWSPGQIVHAGFDPGVFVADLERMGFRVAVIGRGKPKPVTGKQLLSMPYHPGVLLTLAR